MHISIQRQSVRRLRTVDSILPHNTECERREKNSSMPTEIKE